MGPPGIKDWKTELSRHIDGRRHTREDLGTVIRMCRETLADMQPAHDFLREQRALVQTWLQQYELLYVSRFDEPPPRCDADLPHELLLDTPDSRKRAVRAVALSMTAPGGEINDEQVLQSLLNDGQRLVADNPTATISTILNGFKSHFEKVSGKRGVFKRREHAHGG